MKIEKVNDHQIRCTLTRADLADRQLKLSELAYGTQKAKDLFRDMMQQAAAKFGFEAEDIPLMIEAIPINGDSIVLIITKVEDPEELDTRFSKFAPSLHDAEDGGDEDAGDSDHDDILDLFRRVQSSRKPKEEEQTDDSSSQGQASEAPTSEDTVSPTSLVGAFVFDSLTDLCRIAPGVIAFYHGQNTLYKNPDTGKYHLILNQSDTQARDFNRLCNNLSEYGKPQRYLKSRESFMKEHYTPLIPDQALQQLAKMELLPKL